MTNYIINAKAANNDMEYVLPSIAVHPVLNPEAKRAAYCFVSLWCLTWPQTFGARTPGLSRSLPSLDGVDTCLFAVGLLTHGISRSSGLDAHAPRRNKEEKFLKMKADYAREGMRRAIHAVLLVNSHGPSRLCRPSHP